METVISRTIMDVAGPLGPASASLGVVYAVLVLFLAQLGSWGVVHLVWIPRYVKSYTATLDGFLIVRLEAFFVKVADSLREQAHGVVDAAKIFFSDITPNLLRLVVLIAIGLFVLIWNAQHATILQEGISLVQCYARPLIDDLLFPILNAVRLAYSAVYVLVNGAVEIYWALTWGGNLRVLIACTTKDYIRNIFDKIADAFVELLVSAATWLGTGMIGGMRLELVPTLHLIGEAVNATRPIADCYCFALGPLWDLVFALPQIASLHTALDCTVNVAARAVQIVLNSLVLLQMPTFRLLADETVCGVTSLGDAIERAVELIIEMFAGIFALIDDFLNTLSVGALAQLSTGSGVATASAAIHAGALDLPPALAAHYQKPGRLRRGLGLASRAATRDALLSSLGASGLRAAHITSAANASNATTTPPLAPFGEAPFTFWSFLRDLNLVVLLGLDALLRLASVPFMRILSEPASVLVGAVNMTLEFAFHPIEAFQSVDGLRFFQVGFLGDRTRVVADTLAQILIVFDRSLPCALSRPLQAFVSLPETVIEVFFTVLFATIFPPWEPGVPSLVNCSLVRCGHPAPANWSFFDIFPKYYAWNESRAHRTLDILRNSGECAAFVLGCNTTAENNNSTNVRSNCTTTPAACIARSANRLATEVYNATLAFVFYLPDLVRFSPVLHTFRDIPLKRTEEAWRELVTCVSNWLDTLDENGEQCLTETVPEDRVGPNDQQMLPGDVPPETLPVRSKYTCAPDGSAYYLDGRRVILRLTNGTSFYDAAATCDPTTDDRLCALATNGFVSIFGSLPGSANMTVAVTPDMNGTALRLTVDNTTGALTASTPLDNASALLSAHDISSVSAVDCTSATVPQQIPPEVLCSNSLAQFGDLAYQALPNALSPLILAGIVYVNTPDADYSNPIFYTTKCISEVSSSACIGGTLHYRERYGGAYAQVLTRLTVVPVTDTPIVCIVDSSVPRGYRLTNAGYTCYLGRVVATFVTNSFPKTRFFNSTNGLTEVAYVSATAGNERKAVPCVTTTPYIPYQMQQGTLVCDPARNVSIYPDWNPPYDAGVAYQDFDYHITAKAKIPCVPNTASAPPVCWDVTLNYTTGGHSVHMRVEGVEVTVTIDGAPATPACDYLATGATSVSAASAGTLLSAAGEGASLGALVRRARARVQAELVRRDASAPVIRAGLLVPGSETRAVLVAAFNLNMTAHGIVNATTTSLYRKESFLCCLSGYIRSLGIFFVSYAYEWIYLWQALLSIAPFPHDLFKVPTFEEAKENLRDAGCKLACAITMILPVQIDCLSLKGEIGCSRANSCARNILCDMFDLILLVADIVVEILRMAKALAAGNQPSSTILGATCTPNDIANCVVSFIVYVVTKVIFTFTLVSRAVAAFLDCLLCALSLVADPSHVCVPTFFAFIDALADFVDGIGATYITAVINVLVGLVQAIIYLFAGEFDKLLNVLVDRVLGNIAKFFTRLGELLLQLLLRIPGIKDLVGFVIDISRSACYVLNKLITAGFGRPLDCAMLGKKRGVSAASGWLAGLDASVTAVWTGDAAGSDCAARMTSYNASAADVLDEEQLREVAFCLAAHLWLGPTAQVPAVMAAAAGDPALFVSPCDLLLPNMYGAPWTAVSAAVRSQAGACIEARAYGESARADASARWLPADLFYNPWQLPALVSDALLAYDIWVQYDSDRRTTAATLVSPAYRALWHDAGYATAHIDGLAAAAVTVADVYAPIDDDAAAAASNFSVAAYVDRALAQQTASDRTAARFGAAAAESQQRRPQPARIAAMMTELFEPLLSSRSVINGGESMPAFVMRGAFDYLSAAADAATLSVSISAALPWQLAAGSDDKRQLTHIIGGLVDAVTVHAAGIVVKVVRAVSAPTGSMKRALRVGVALPVLLWKATHGALQLWANWAGGRLVSGAAWANEPGVAAWLGAHSSMGITALPSAERGDASPVTAALQSVLRSAGGMFMARAAVLTEGVPLLEAALSDADVTAASIRRLRMSRLVATASLGAARALQRERFALPDYAATRFVATWDLAEGHTTPPSKLLMSTANVPTNNRSGLPCRLPILTCVPPTNFSNCTASYPFCNDTACLVLDQLLGYVFEAVTTVARHYGALPLNCSIDPTLSICFLPLVEPSLNFSRQAFAAFALYAPSNSSVPVILGDSPELPARWPWRTYDNWRVLGDPTPNKMRFTDIAALAERSLEFIRRPVNDSSSGDSNSKTPSLTSMFKNATSFIFNAILGTHSARMASASTSGVFLTLGDVILAWLNTFYQWFFRCNYDTELNGSRKRFSIGEVAFGALAVAVVVSLLLQVVVPSSLLMMLGSVGTVFGIVLAVGTLVFAYDWSYFCAPALPLQLGDDLLYFAAHTLAPKCPLIGGIVNEPEYNNSNCYACSGWRTGRWTVPDFFRALEDGGSIGLRDIRYNIGYALRAYWPAASEWLQTTGRRIPVLGALLALDAVAEPLAAFNNFSRATATNVRYSQLELGHWVVTLVPNLLVLLIVALLVALFWPFVGLAVGILQNVLLLTVVMLAFSTMGLFTIGALIGLSDARGPAADDGAEGDPATETEMTPMTQQSLFGSIFSDENDGNVDVSERRRRKRAALLQQQQQQQQMNARAMESRPLLFIPVERAGVV